MECVKYEYSFSSNLHRATPISITLILRELKEVEAPSDYLSLDNIIGGFPVGSIIILDRGVHRISDRGWGSI